MAQTKLYTKVSNESDDETDNKEPLSLPFNKTHINTRNGVISLLFNPKFIIFTLCLLASIIFIFYWFINEDLTFAVCGIIGLLMCIFAIFAFRMSLEYKQTMQLYKSLNRAVKMDYQRCKAEIDRTREAIKILEETKQRLIINNGRNKKNYKIFENMTELIQENGNNNTYNNSVSMAEIWKKQNIENVKETLLKVYDRFVNDIVGDDNTTIIKQEQITEFEQMLPIELREKFAVIDIFNELCVNGDGGVNNQQFIQYLHKFATLEVDMSKPITKTQKKKPKKTVVSSTKISGQTPSTTAHNDVLQTPYKDHEETKSVNDKNDDKSDEEINETDHEKKSDGQIAMDYHDEKASESGVLISPQTKSESPLIVVVDSTSNNHKNNKNLKDKTETDGDGKKSTKTNSNNDETNLCIFDEEEYQQSAKKPSPIITIQNVDTDASGGTNNEEQRRKVGKLKHKWGQSYKDEKGKYTPKSKKIKEDESWVKHKIAKPIHPVHESIDALQIDKLVSKAQIVKRLSTTNESDEEDEFQFNLPKQKSRSGKIKRKKSRESGLATPTKVTNPDESWVKFKKEPVHPVHESVDALEINRLVSKANIMDVLNNVEPIGEEQDTDNQNENGPKLNKRKSKKTDE